MSVQLSVVGIFYTQDINVGSNPNMTVQTVMNEAQTQSTSTEVIFRYTAIGLGSQSVVNSMLAYHKVPFTSRSGKKYPPGIYRLGQSFTQPTPNPYTVWQYYLFDRGNQRVPIKGEPSYAVTKVEDGWKIVWRLVTVCNGPTGLAHRMESILPSDALKPELF